MKTPILTGFACVALTSFASALEAKAFEVAPVLQASQILPAELLQGPHHRVREMAPSDGYLTHYTIDSDFGVFKCVGRRQLEERVQELGAIAKLAAVSKSDLFADGLKKSVEAPIDAVKNIVDDPQEAIKQAPKTVGHFFSKVGDSIGNAARKVGRKIDESGEEETSEALADTGRGIGEAAKSVAGFDLAKLDTARQLGVDPYSDNQRLQDEMEKVTWAFFAGGLPLRVGAAAASGGASVALTATKAVGLPEDIYDTTPGELNLRDREALVAMGVSETVINEVLLNPAMTISLRHSIVESLKKLPAGPAKAEVIGIAQGLAEVRQVEFLNQALEELIKRHRLAPYQELKVFGRLPAGITADGVMEVPAPVDEVFWTAQVAEFAGRQDLGAGKRRLLLGGSLSPAASAGFQSTGWEVVAVP
ncbi:hypothetical protein [Haloferula rosea]|uniref:Uncharacterized protein n=1 Tax=Haloferula rosea TaxID=490093 RepID=A0A934VB49_9BACT|nr:hypothetical protein [Haloferula rosea]MBK1827013.1 hypothetical protein [Haloferula rosea]